MRKFREEHTTRSGLVQHAIVRALWAIGLPIRFISIQAAVIVAYDEKTKSGRAT